MPGITPIPTSRVSDQLVRQRVLSQLRFDQQELFRLQNQISSGFRISLPSDDPPAATRAIGLQSLLERKGQAQINLRTNQSYLNATDSALANVSSVLANARGDALSVVGTTATDLQRQAAAEQVRRTIEQLVDVGNHQFRGRYLFAGGTSTAPPYELVGKYVQYHGDERTLSSFADLDLLFETNVHGNEVFGGVSEPVRGAADLTPIVTAETRLADLRGGAGISPGAVSVSDGIYTSIIDLSDAETVGDVAALLEAYPPGWDAEPVGGRNVTVTLTATGLNVSLTGGTFGLTIQEVAGGTTAAELGVLHAVDNGAAAIVGDDLDPRLQLTTQLSNLLGTRPTATLVSAGSDNDLVIEARQRGTAFNGVAVQLVDDALLRPGSGLAVGDERSVFTTTAVTPTASLEFNGSFNNDILLTATSSGTSLNNITVSLATRTADGNGVQLTYNATLRSYAISVEDGVHTAADVVAAIQADGVAAGPFTATLDASSDGANNGSYVFTSADANPNVGSTGNSGAAANTLLVYVNRDHTTARHVVDAINDDPVVGDLFSAALTNKDSAGEIYEGTGAIDLTATAVTAGGSGVEFDLTSGLRVTNGGREYVLDLTTAETVEDLLNILNGSPAGLLAEINALGTGIDVRSRLSGSDFSIGENGGTTATELGIRSLTTASPLADLNYGRGVRSIPGNDFIIRRSDGVNLAIDLDGAVTVGDLFERINNHPSNLAGPTRVVARFTTVGNGLELLEASPSGTRPLAVDRENLSGAAIDLGWVQEGKTTSAAPVSLSSGGVAIQSPDIHPQETDSVFNTLIRLATALEDNDQREIQRVVALLNDDIERVNLTRAEVGARQQSLDVLGDRLESETIELRSSLSDEIDVDLAEAISNLVGRQAALEASLRMSAQTLQLSLMDFL